MACSACRRAASAPPGRARETPWRTGLFVCVALLCCSAGGVAAKPWDLSTYELCRKGELRGIPSQTSGVTFSEETNTIFIITRNPQAIMEYDLEGDFVREYPWERKFHDPEGITWLHAYTFAIVEEGVPRIAVVDIAPWLEDGMELLFYIDLEDQIEVEAVKGLEGLAYDRDSGKILTIQEQDPKMFWAVSLDGTAEQMFDGESLPVRDLSGMYYREKEQGIFIVSQQDWRVVNIDLEGNEMQVVGIDGQFPEGIAFTPDGALMIIVGEPDEIFIYTSTGSCQYTPGRFKWKSGGSDSSEAVDSMKDMEEEKVSEEEDPTGGQYVEGAGWIPLTEEEKKIGGKWVGDKWVSKTEPGGRWVDGTWLPLTLYDKAVGGDWVDGIWVRDDGTRSQDLGQLPLAQLSPPPPTASPPSSPPPAPQAPSPPPLSSPPTPQAPSSLEQQKVEQNAPAEYPAAKAAAPVPGQSSPIAPVLTEMNDAGPVTLSMEIAVVADSTISSGALAQLLRMTLAEVGSGQAAPVYFGNLTTQLAVQAEAPAVDTSTKLGEYLFVFTFQCDSLIDSQMFAENIGQLAASGALAQQLGRKAGSKTINSVRVVGETVTTVPDRKEATQMSLLLTILCGAGLASLVLVGVLVAWLRFSHPAAASTLASAPAGKPGPAKTDSTRHPSYGGSSSGSGSSVQSMDMRGMSDVAIQLERDPKDGSKAELLCACTPPGHSRSPSVAENWAPACHAGAQHMYWTPPQIWHHRRPSELPSELDKSRTEWVLEGSVPTPTLSLNASLVEDKNYLADQQTCVGASPLAYPASPEESVHEIRLEVYPKGLAADNSQGAGPTGLPLMSKWMGLHSRKGSHGFAEGSNTAAGISVNQSVIEADVETSFIEHSSIDESLQADTSIIEHQAELESSTVEDSTAVLSRIDSLGLDDLWLPPPPAAEAHAVLTPRLDTSAWVDTQRMRSRHRRTGSGMSTSRGGRGRILHRRGDSSAGDLWALHNTLSGVPTIDSSANFPDGMVESQEAQN